MAKKYTEQNVDEILKSFELHTARIYALKFASEKEKKKLNSDRKCVEFYLNDKLDEAKKETFDKRMETFPKKEEIDALINDDKEEYVSVIYGRNAKMEYVGKHKNLSSLFNGYRDENRMLYLIDKKEAEQDKAKKEQFEKTVSQIERTYIESTEFEHMWNPADGGVQPDSDDSSVAEETTHTESADEVQPTVTEFDPKYEWIKPSQTKENKEFAAFVKNSPVMEEYFKDGESDIPFELFDEEAQQSLRALIVNYEKGTDEEKLETREKISANINMSLASLIRKYDETLSDEEIADLATVGIAKIRAVKDDEVVEIPEKWQDFVKTIKEQEKLLAEPVIEEISSDTQAEAHDDGAHSGENPEETAEEHSIQAPNLEELNVSPAINLTAIPMELTVNFPEDYKKFEESANFPEGTTEDKKLESFFNLIYSKNPNLEGYSPEFISCVNTLRDKSLNQTCLVYSSLAQDRFNEFAEANHIPAGIVGSIRFYESERTSADENVQKEFAANNALAQKYSFEEIIQTASNYAFLDQQGYAKFLGVETVDFNDPRNLGNVIKYFEKESALDKDGHFSPEFLEKISLSNIMLDEYAQTNAVKYANENIDTFTKFATENGMEPSGLIPSAYFYSQSILNSQQKVYDNKTQKFVTADEYAKTLFEKPVTLQREGLGESKMSIPTRSQEIDQYRIGDEVIGVSQEIKLNNGFSPQKIISTTDKNNLISIIREGKVLANFVKTENGKVSLTFADDELSDKFTDYVRKNAIETDTITYDELGRIKSITLDNLVVDKNLDIRVKSANGKMACLFSAFGLQITDAENHSVVYRNHKIEGTENDQIAPYDIAISDEFIEMAISNQQKERVVDKRSASFGKFEITNPAFNTILAGTMLDSQHLTAENDTYETKTFGNPQLKGAITTHVFKGYNTGESGTKYGRELKFVEHNGKLYGYFSIERAIPGKTETYEKLPTRLFEVGNIEYEKAKAENEKGSLKIALKYGRTNAYTLDYPLDSDNPQVERFMAETAEKYREPFNAFKQNTVEDGRYFIAARDYTNEPEITPNRRVASYNKNEKAYTVEEPISYDEPEIHEQVVTPSTPVTENPVRGENIPENATTTPNDSTGTPNEQEKKKDEKKDDKKKLVEPTKDKDNPFKKWQNWLGASVIIAIASVFIPFLIPVAMAGFIASAVVSTSPWEWNKKIEERRIGRANLAVELDKQKELIKNHNIEHLQSMNKNYAEQTVEINKRIAALIEQNDALKNGDSKGRLTSGERQGKIDNLGITNAQIKRKEEVVSNYEKEIDKAVKRGLEIPNELDEISKQNESAQTAIEKNTILQDNCTKRIGEINNEIVTLKTTLQTKLASVTDEEERTKLTNEFNEKIAEKEKLRDEVEKERKGYEQKIVEQKELIGLNEVKARELETEQRELPGKITEYENGIENTKAEIAALQDKKKAIQDELTTDEILGKMGVMPETERQKLIKINEDMISALEGQKEALSKATEKNKDLIEALVTGETVKQKQINARTTADEALRETDLKEEDKQITANTATVNTDSMKNELKQYADVVMKQIKEANTPEELEAISQDIGQKQVAVAGMKQEKEDAKKDDDKQLDAKKNELTTLEQNKRGTAGDERNAYDKEIESKKAELKEAKKNNDMLQSEIDTLDKFDGGFEALKKLLDDKKKELSGPTATATGPETVNPSAENPTATQAEASTTATQTPPDKDNDGRSM